MNRIVLMCDYGLDDAAATLYVLDNRGQTPVDILTIAGNSSAERSMENAVKLLSNYEGSLENVRIVDTSAQKQNYCNLPSIHGEDGLGDFLTERELSLPRVSFDSWITEKEPTELVSLGPCTLTEVILKKRTVTSLLIMGGNVCDEPNFNGYEFNHYLDKPAFEYCVKNYPGHVAATLDSCRHPSFNLAGKRFEGEKLLCRVLNKSAELAEARHKDRCFVYDYIAVRSLFEPDLFTVELAVDKDGNRINMLRCKE